MNTGFDFSMVLDFVLAALLAATIVYAVILDRKLGAIRKSRDEMESLIKDFAESTVKAEKGLAELRQHAESSGKDLQAQIGGATKVLNDLKFLVERGESLSDQLESASAQARNRIGGVRGIAKTATTTSADEVGKNSLAKEFGADAKVKREAVTQNSTDGSKAPDKPISQRLELTSENPGAGALLKALQRMR